MYIKGEIDGNSVKGGDLTSHWRQWVDLPDKKIDKETVSLNDTLDQIYLIDIFRAFHPNITEYTFFSSSHGIFSRIDHKY